MRRKNPGECLELSRYSVMAWRAVRRKSTGKRTGTSRKETKNYDGGIKNPGGKNRGESVLAQTNMGMSDIRVRR